MGMDVLEDHKSVLEILTMFHHCCATKMHQIRFCLGSALTPMDELTVTVLPSPKAPSWI